MEECVWRRASSFVTRLVASRRANSRLSRNDVSKRPLLPEGGELVDLERFRQRRHSDSNVSPSTSCLVFSTQKREKSMIFDRFPGRRGGRLIPGARAGSAVAAA